MNVPLRYIQEYRNRHGKLYRYFRRPGGPKIPLRGEPGSPEFVAAYNAALGGHKIKPEPSRSPPGTVSAAIAAYYTDNSFLSLAAGTRTMRRAILERFRARKGEKRLAKLEAAHVARMLGQMKPFAARNWLKTLRGLMKFAVATGLRADDPTAAFEPAEAKAGTIHTWTEDEIAIYERRYALGSTPYTAMALMLYPAARRSDAVSLGPQHIREGRLVYRQQKTGRTLSIPIHPRLAEALSAAQAGHLSFLVSAHGKPFSAAGLGNAMRKWCDAAGLPECSSHGLRKAQARRLAEAGCSVHEIAAITGHKTLAEVQRYTAAAEQAKMADAAIARTSIVHLPERVDKAPANALRQNGAK